MPRPDAGRAGNAVATLGFAILLSCAWLTLHLQWGLQHDAVLYTMQGLSHLHPQLYANDIYLKYGSQDRYTLFGWLYALPIGAWGIDHAAFLVTLLSQLALLLAAWQLARQLMSSDLAWAAVALLVSVELIYGSQNIFTVVEDFLSPRQLAEAAVLAALTAALQRRRLPCLLWLAAAAALHPLMALAGIVWLLAFHAQAARRRMLIAALALAAIAVLLLLLRWLGSSLSTREDWINLALSRAPYLVLSNWSLLDWSRLAPPVATLCVVAISGDPPQHSTAGAALVIASTGLLLTAVGADWLHIVTVLQIQPWRWTWLAVALGALLLPAAAVQLWSLRAAGRTCLALLLASLFFHDHIASLGVGALAVAAALLAIRFPQALTPRHQAWLLWGAVAILAVAIAWDVANRAIYAQIPVPYLEFAELPRISELRRALRGSMMPAAVLTSIWWLAFRTRVRARTPLLLAAAGAAVWFTSPLIASRWSRLDFPPGFHAAFSAWREQIPPGMDVLWPANPLYAWVYLERPSFYSEAQRATTLFSQAAADEMRRRYQGLAPFLAFEGAGIPILPSAAARPDLTLQALCERSAVRYIVTRRRFATAPIGTLPADLSPRLRGLRLYRCAGES
jgi:hypothetical protein